MNIKWSRLELGLDFRHLRWSKLHLGFGVFWILSMDIMKKVLFSTVQLIGLLPYFRPEDIEEISDEEAEWSDEGDPIYPMDFDVDFGQDWDYPVKEFDYFSAG